MPHQRVGDVQLHYEVHGQGEPLLLIHGLGSSTEDWEAQLPAFSQRYQVITVDVRGHGRSDKPAGPYSILQFARDIAELLRALRTGPVHVVGISMGGMIAFQLAVDAPELTRSLVIVNSGPEVVLRTLRERLLISSRFFILRFFGLKAMTGVLAKKLFPKPEQTQLRATFIERWNRNDPVAYEHALRAIVGWSVADRISALRVPIQVVTADQDYTPVSAKEAYVGKLAGAELVVIADSRHATPMDQPERFNDVVLGFLAKHSSSGAGAVSSGT
ncbi:MAG: alpha/beta hydrolase [Myxococcaceae bacterium]|nr:alpha/beta hydrolase [Myxococcaceae bacterium]